jgi:two-component system, OmpR family, osmolarity sensor histidine kinase EnvZ
MRFWPQSLLWRTFALMTIMLFGSLLAWIALFSLYQREPRGQQIAQQIAAIVNLTRVSLIAARPEARAAVLREISESEQIQVYLGEPNEVLKPLPNSAPVKRMETLVSQRLGTGTVLAGERNGEPGVWISFKIEDDAYWVRLKRDRIDNPPQVQFLMWGVGALLAALGVALIIVSRITRPLKALRQAANKVGKAETLVPLPEQGAQELRDVTRAFNQMARDLKQQDEDRALVLAGISHDLRTPLARLRLEAEMSGSDAQRDGMVSDIEQMDAIIGQFLDFARVTREGTEQFEATNLSEIVETIAHDYARHAALAQVPLTTHVEPNLFAHVSGKLMHRAIVNLLENALRHGVMPDQPARISLDIGRDGQQVRIEVADHGPGVPPDQLSRVLQPFARLETARTDVTGSGLGLAIVSRIVQRAGGSFVLVNQPQDAGTGLIARLSLPLIAR